MSEKAPMTPEEFEDEQTVLFTQAARKDIVNNLLKDKDGRFTIPRDEGGRIMAMQALDGLSSVAMKRQSNRQKAKADEQQNDMLKNLAGQVLLGMVGQSGRSTRVAKPTLTIDHKQTYTEGELSTAQEVIDESHIIAARDNIIPS